MKENSPQMPMVSVVITTYNRANMVRRAIQSVLSQTYKDFELIVVDDCSNDNTEEVVEAFHDPRLRYIRHDQNRGLSAARNTGIKELRGKYVAFLDDDDEWKAEKLERQIELANAKSSTFGVIYCGAVILNSEDKIIGENMPKLKGNIRSEIVKKGLFTIPSTFLFTRDVLEDIDGFDENLGSHVDHDIWMKMAKGNYYTDYVKKPLVINYRHNEYRMTADVQMRIRATEQYIEKWQSEIEKWLGEKKGQKYCLDFYAKAIGRLGLSLLKQKNFKGGFSCFYKVLRHDPINARSYLLIVKLLVIALIGNTWLYPPLKKLKNAIVKT